MRCNIDYFEAPTCMELTEKVNEFYKHHNSLRVVDVAYLSEMRANRLNPSQALVFFICIVTYEVINEFSAD